MGYSADYCDLLSRLISPGASQDTNRRTGKQIRVLRGAHTLQIDLREEGQLPVPGNRRVFPRTAAAEIAWFLQGTRDVRWLRGHAPIWDKFAESDGNTVDAAYGYRWREHFGRDQVSAAVDALRADPSDRRVFVCTWDPASDGLGAREQKNVPCPLGFTLSQLGEELHMLVPVRSSDVFVGLPYDVMGHSLLLDALAATLGARPGVLTMALAHPHLYEPHWEMARTSLNSERFVKGPQLPGWTLDRIEAGPDGYVKRVHDSCETIPLHPSNFKPELVL